MVESGSEHAGPAVRGLATQYAPVFVVPVGIADEGIQDEVFREAGFIFVFAVGVREGAVESSDNVGEGVIGLVEACGGVVAGDFTGEHLVAVEEVPAAHGEGLRG